MERRTFRPRIWYLIDRRADRGDRDSRGQALACQPACTSRAAPHLRDPGIDLAVERREVNDAATLHRIADEAWRSQPRSAEQPYSIEEWPTGSPMVTLTLPTRSPPGDPRPGMTCAYPPVGDLTRVRRPCAHWSERCPSGPR